MPHERTLPKAKTDRLELLRATRANLDPIWGLSLAGGLSALLDPATPSPTPPRSTRTAFHHSLWRIDDPDAHRRHPRRGRPAPAGARRRPPPLRDRQQLPARAARGRHRRPRRRRDHDAGRRARPRPALRARHPPAARTASAASTSATRSAAPFFVARRRTQRARGRRRARGGDARRRRARPRRPPTAWRCSCRTAELDARARRAPGRAARASTPPASTPACCPRCRA